MRISHLLAVTLTISTGLLCPIEAASAVRLADGKVYFIQPPSLESAITTFNNTYMWGATYYFTLKIPENAGEPLQKVTIEQQEGVDEIGFDLKDTSAFEGTRRRKGEKISLTAIADRKQRRTLTIVFEPPVSPGKTITIALNPLQNPRYAGIYLFGVTAFPAGDLTHGQFLGFGRLHFYDRRDIFFP